MTAPTCPDCGCLIGVDYAAGHRPGCAEAVPPIERALERADAVAERLGRIDTLLARLAAGGAA